MAAAYAVIARIVVQVASIALPAFVAPSLHDTGATTQARHRYRREYLPQLRRCPSHHRQHRRTHSHPRHPRPLCQARRAGGGSPPTGSARTARYGRVRPLATTLTTNQARPHEAATLLQGCARPRVGNRRDMAMDGEATRLHGSEIPLVDSRSALEPALARPPPNRKTGGKGRLNFLYSQRQRSHLWPARQRFCPHRRPGADQCPRRRRHRYRCLRSPVRTDHGPPLRQRLRFLSCFSSPLPNPSPTRGERLTASIRVSRRGRGLGGGASPLPSWERNSTRLELRLTEHRVGGPAKTKSMPM